MSKSNPETLKIKARARRLQAAKGLSPLIAEACAGIDEFLEASKAGEPLEGLCTIRTRTLDLSPRKYSPQDVRAVREQLKASQALFAKFLGVTPTTVSYWELGRRKVPSIACRYLDDIQEFPELWTKRLKMATAK